MSPYSLFQSDRLAGFVVGGLVCAGLVGGMVSPAWAGGGSDPSGEAPVLGAFVLGDGLEASIEDRDGSFHFAVPVGGLTLAWDSRAAASNADGLGPAWGFGFTRILTGGGIEVGLPNGKRYRPDETQPSGLAGYGVEDTVFSQSGGTLPARDSDPGLGLPGSTEIPYSFTLTELGGTVTSYNAAGDPITQISAVGARTDWMWDELVPHRLIAIVNPDGMVTSLDWDSEPGAVLVTAGVNLPGETDPVTGEVGAVPVSRIELDGGRVSSVVDAAGGRTTVDYDDDTALVSAISNPSGATTSVAWRLFDDGTVRAERVRTTDATGHELSARGWAPAGNGLLSSGWPGYGGEDDLFWSGDPSIRYSTTVTDGATRVVSEYNALHVLLQRATIATTSSGDRVIETQAIGYPDMQDGGLPDPEALPGNWASPATTESTRIDASGAERSTRQAHEYDRFGRPVSQTSHDGTVTTTEYDEIIPKGSALPIGLPITVTTTAPDGQISLVRHFLDDTRTAVLATEVLQGRRAPATEPSEGEPGDGLVRTSYAEFEVGERGLVTAESMFPGGDPAASPAVTRRERVVDLGAGTTTTTETIGTATESVATTSSVQSLRHGGTLMSTDPLGNTARVGHDATGRPVVAVSAAGNIATIAVETAQRDGRNATTTTAPDGVATTEIRDALGRVTQIVDNIRDGVVDPSHTRVVETRAYPEPGTTVRTDAWGATTTARQDVFGRPVRTITPNGLVQVTDYDDVANTITTGLTPTGDLADAERVTIETKDDVGRTIAAGGSRRDGQRVPEHTTAYDGVGRVVRDDDGLMTTEYEYDAFGNPATTVFTPNVEAADAGAASGHGLEPVTASRRFDGFGTSLQKVLSTDREARSGVARTMDVFGRTTSEVDQLGRESTFEYTVDGLVSKAILGSGQVIEREYDPVTREPVEQTVTSPAGEAVRSATEFDTVTGRVTSVFDPADRAGTEIQTSYDAHGNPLTVTYPDGAQVAYGYDAHGRRTTTTDVAGAVTTLTHTPEGQLTRAVQHDADGNPMAEVEYEYDQYGRVHTLSRGNGVRTEYTFTSASLIATEVTTESRGLVLADRTYTYDDRGNLTERVDITRNPGEQPETTTTMHAYDAFDRLVETIAHGGGPDAAVTERVSYELTVSGDIRALTTTETHVETGAETTKVRQFEYSPLGELVATSTTTKVGAADEPGVDETVRHAQTYDAAGNVTLALDGTTYEYDAANRPVTETASDGTVFQTAYWADGTRKHQTTTAPGADVADRVGFYWDGTALINDVHAPGPRTGADPAQTGTASYLLGASRHTRTATDDAGRAVTSYYGSDRHANVTDLTDADGAPMVRYTYTDYGVQHVAPTSPDHPLPTRGLHRNPYGYAGEYADQTGTLHLRVRSYHPDTMRFTTMDTAELHNLYAYADLNPVTKVDPTGRSAILDNENWIVIGLGIAGIVGAILTLAMFPVAPAVVGAAAAGVAPVVAPGAAAGALSAKLLTAIKIGTYLGIVAEGIAIAGAGMEEGGVTSESLGLEFPLEEVMQWSQVGAGVSAFSVLTGVEAAIALGAKAARAASRAWKAGRAAAAPMNSQEPSTITLASTTAEQELQLLVDAINVDLVGFRTAAAGIQNGLPSPASIANPVVRKAASDIRTNLTTADIQMDRLVALPGKIRAATQGGATQAFEDHLAELVLTIETAWTRGDKAVHSAQSAASTAQLKQLRAPFERLDMQTFSTTYPRLYESLATTEPRFGQGRQQLGSGRSAPLFAPTEDKGRAF